MSTLARYTYNGACNVCGERTDRRFRWYLSLVIFQALFTWRHRGCAAKGGA